jgi:glycosyltransferase involved in cell wall biosynthesis
LPKVSICIPAYNQIEYLKRAIDSVLIQSFKDYEIIITDDSSSDTVTNFIKRYQHSDVIKYFKNPAALGSPENWNEGIRKASGEYIKILHHDDWLNYDYSLAKYVALLNDNPEADFAFSATQAINPNGKDWVHSISIEQLKKLQLDPLLLYTNNLIGAPSTTIFKNNGEMFFDRNLKWLVDIDYYLRQLNKNKNVAYSPELLTVTFLAHGRITDECTNNKKVEVYEYFYLLNVILKKKKKYKKEDIKVCIMKALNICKKYEISNENQIKECGYYGAVPPSIKSYFMINRFSHFLAKTYLKLL